MSQLNDITKTFREFAKRNKWTKKETAANMLTILSDIEWGTPIDDVIDGNGNIDYSATYTKELGYVFDLLWSEEQL